MKVLFVADIVGDVGMRMAEEHIHRLRRSEAIDFVVVNGENAAAKNGIDRALYRRLSLAGADCITLGNHCFDCAEVLDFIDTTPDLIRPYNYPPGTAGRGWYVIDGGKERLAVAVLLGNVYLSTLPSPFLLVDELLREIKFESGCNNILLDIHAEATSEKIALGYYLDGKVAAVIGTHTHVQTADEKILPQGTGYLTDCGMCGAYHSVLGVECANAIHRFQSQMPVRFKQSIGQGQFNACVLDLQNGRTTAIKRINIVEK